MSSLVVAGSTELTTIDEEQLVTMMVDSQLFGIPILKVQDIVEPDQITPVPCAPGAIAGVLNLRGRIVTVIDLRELLGAGESEQTRQMSVTVEHKGDLYTLLVDSIGDVRSLPKKDFDTPPATLDENMRRLCSGIFRLEDNLLVVLDVDRILDEETIMKSPRRTRRRRTFKPALKSVDTADDADKDPAPADVEETVQDAVSTAAPAVKKSGGAGLTAVSPRKAANDQPAATAKPAQPPKPAVSVSPASPSAPGAKPLDALGGRSKVASYAERVFAAVMTDPVLSHFAEGHDIEAARDGFIEAVITALSETDGGALEDLKVVLQVLVREQGLDDDHFIAVAKHANDVLARDRAPDAAVHAVLEIIDGLRNEVITH